MMIAVILCEGNSDRILLSYYIMHNWGYKYSEFGPQWLSKDFKFSKEDCSWFIDKAGEFLFMGSVGGSDFTKYVEDFLDYTNKAEKQNAIKKLAIVTDNDDKKSVAKRLKETEDIFLKMGFSAKADKADGWKQYGYKNGFGDQGKIEKVVILQPQNGEGNLETFLLEAIAEKSENEKMLVHEAKEFIHRFAGTQYLKKRGDKSKAELAVTFSVISPRRVFAKIDVLLKSVDWSRYDRFNEQYKPLKRIGK